MLKMVLGVSYGGFLNYKQITLKIKFKGKLKKINRGHNSPSKAKAKLPLFFHYLIAQLFNKRTQSDYFNNFNF